MPALVVVPANPDDLEAVARLQFEAFAQDEPFNTIFPKGLTPDTLQHTMAQLENDMDNDFTLHLMLVKDALTNAVAAYATWHFYPQRSQNEVEREMLTDHFPLPRDADHEVGNRLVHNGVRKHHEMVARHFGPGAPHACRFGFQFLYAPRLTFTYSPVCGGHQSKVLEAGRCFYACAVGC